MSDAPPAEATIILDEPAVAPTRKRASRKSSSRTTTWRALPFGMKYGAAQ